jgi:hypothetical protein
VTTSFPVLKNKEVVWGAGSLICTAANDAGEYSPLNRHASSDRLIVTLKQHVITCFGSYFIESNMHATTGADVPRLKWRSRSFLVGQPLPSSAPFEKWKGDALCIDVKYVYKFMINNL